MGLNMCVDITDTSNTNGKGVTYPYQSLDILHAIIEPVKQLNYDCAQDQFDKTGAYTMMVSSSVALITTYALQL